MEPTETTDADTAEVLETLSGAQRRPLDPDTQLASMLAGLTQSEDEADFQRVLDVLVRDAHHD